MQVRFISMHVFLFSVLLLSGCTPLTKNKTKNGIKKRSRVSRSMKGTEYAATQYAAAQHAARYEEARLFDIPLPIGSKLFMCSAHSGSENNESESNEPNNHENDTVSRWVTGSSCSEVYDFYHHYMEQSGWQETGHIRGAEQLLQYVKPDRMCVIVLRPRENHVSETVITLFCTLRDQLLVLE